MVDPRRVAELAAAGCGDERPAGRCGRFAAATTTAALAGDVLRRHWRSVCRQRRPTPRRGPCRTLRPTQRRRPSRTVQWPSHSEALCGSKALASPCATRRPPRGRSRIHLVIQCGSMSSRERTASVSASPHPIQPTQALTPRSGCRPVWSLEPLASSRQTASLRRRHSSLTLNSWSFLLQHRPPEGCYVWRPTLLLVRRSEPV